MSKLIIYNNKDDKYLKLLNINFLQDISKIILNYISISVLKLNTKPEHIYPTDMEKTSLKLNNIGIELIIDFYNDLKLHKYLNIIKNYNYNKNTIRLYKHNYINNNDENNNDENKKYVYFTLFNNHTIYDNELKYNITFMDKKNMYQIIPLFDTLKNYINLINDCTRIQNSDYFKIIRLYSDEMLSMIKYINAYVLSNQKYECIITSRNNGVVKIDTLINCNEYFVESF
jgi:hypothetical protein